ncbi:DUF551 domain-containing protein [Enterobacter oligotrophicus]
MSTITRERLEEIAEDGFLKHGESKELARIALASLEAEPVSFDDLRDAVAEVSGGPAMEWSDIYKGHQAVPFINFNSLARIVDKFRTAPPAPVSVPDAMDDQGGVCCEVSYADGWNACRASMLQGADGNSPVIPDGWVACSERMPEQFAEVLACTEDGGRYIAALNQRMTWDDGDFFDDIQDVTHWQPLPSPPAK